MLRLADLSHASQPKVRHPQCELPVHGWRERMHRHPIRTVCERQVRHHSLRRWPDVSPLSTYLL